MPEGNPSQNVNRLIERITLAIYTIYQVAMLGIAVYLHWAPWTMVVFATFLVVEWVYFAFQYGRTHGRHMMYASLVEVCLFVFSVNTQDLLAILFPFAAVIVMIGLSAYENVIRVTEVALIVQVLYHWLWIHSVSFSGVDNFLTYGIPIINVIVIQRVIYFWMKKRNESMGRMGQIIADLRMAEQSKDDFLANVSHEIRTPINTINGMSEVLLQEELCKDVRENVVNIQNAGRNLMAVVSDILDFSELQSGKMEIVQETYNITSTINDIINMSMAQKADKQIELVVDCDPTLPRGLVGDEKKIRRVVMNLVNNAIKFTEEGGISIEIGYRKEFYGINLIITVRDSGIGMNQESVSKLFTAFNQINTAKNRDKGGIGLGLAISEAIIHGMGGVITVRSKPGKGSSFRVTIPQKVADERPIVVLDNKEDINVLVYTNMERINMREVREGYGNALANMQRGLDISSHICRNFDEVKRRIERETYSNVFVSYEDYLENAAFFDELGKTTRVALILNEKDEKAIENHNLVLLYKPFYVIPVVSILNGNGVTREINDRSHKQSFVAPEVRILIVDDNLMNIRVVQGMLNKYQIHTVQATSGADALELIESKTFDLVFMDHMMPEMDGVETFHRIREKGGSYYTTVPIVALTANAIAGSREMFLAEGFNDFVEKPVDNSVMERVLLRNLPEEKLVYIEDGGAPGDAGAAEQGQPAAKEEQSVEPQTEAAVGIAATEGNRMEKKTFAIGNLDVETGQMYCGGREEYIEILTEYAKKGARNWEPVEDLYAKEDWKNYTIAVHGIKSSMLAIGAGHLSELAKKLEFAGKEDNIAYIRENHAAMVEELRRTINAIAQSEYIDAGSGDDGQAEDLLELSDEAFEEKILAFEEAMYDLDGETMERVAKELSGCSYHGTALSGRMDEVFHKIKMTDYMAAVEVVLTMRDKLKKNS